MMRSTGTSGLILAGSAFSLFYAVAHGGKIDHGGNAGEILHQHARRAKADFLVRFAAMIDPVGKRLNMIFAHRAAVFVPQQVFEQHFHREGKLGDAFQPILFGINQAIISVSLAVEA